MDKKLKVFVTRQIPETGIKLLEKYFDLKVRNREDAISREELKEEIKSCDGIVTMLTDKIDAEILDLAPNLKIVSNFAVGCDNIIIPEATKRGIVVGNTPNVLTQSTAEHALALIMAITKRIVEGDKIMREDSFPGWGPMYMLGTELYNKTIGIIGFGRIGQRLGEMLKGAFNCEILYYDSAEVNNKINAKKTELNELLEKSDIVSLHIPLNEQTRHFMGEEQFKKMKKTAYFINTSRGPVVNEQALLKALQENVIKGAAIDVFEKEPKRLEGLEKCENIIMTPHTGSATWESRSKMAEVAAKNAIGILIEGETPISILNPEVLQK